MLKEIDAKIILAFPDCDMKITAVAEKLMYHRNTITYHIDNIIKSTGLDPCKYHDLSKLLIIAQNVLKRGDKMSWDYQNDAYIKTIEVKYFVPDLEPIEKISVGDWIDLRAAERVELKAGEYRLIRLGVGMILPDGYEALVLPRSSTPSKFGIILANSVGVIDNSYNGDADEWHFPAVAIRDTIIYKGDRIAQFRILENQPRITFKTVSNLKADSRGGIGSTGTR